MSRLWTSISWRDATWTSWWGSLVATSTCGGAVHVANREAHRNATAPELVVRTRSPSRRRPTPRTLTCVHTAAESVGRVGDRPLAHQDLRRPRGCCRVPRAPATTRRERGNVVNLQRSPVVGCCPFVRQCSLVRTQQRLGPALRGRPPATSIMYLHTGANSAVPFAHNGVALSTAVESCVARITSGTVAEVTSSWLCE